MVKVVVIATHEGSVFLVKGRNDGLPFYWQFPTTRWYPKMVRQGKRVTCTLEEEVSQLMRRSFDVDVDANEVKEWAKLTYKPDTPIIVVVAITLRLSVADAVRKGTNRGAKLATRLVRLSELGTMRDFKWGHASLIHRMGEIANAA